MSGAVVAVVTLLALLASSLLFPLSLLEFLLQVFARIVDALISIGTIPFNLGVAPHVVAHAVHLLPVRAIFDPIEAAFLNNDVHAAAGFVGEGAAWSVHR